MKKILLSGFVIFTFIGYALQQRFETEAAGIVTPNVQTTPVAGFSAIATPAPTVAQGSTPPPAQLAGAFRDGQYTGSVADAFYGNVQVQAVITGGKISDVKFLQYPNDRRTSVMINQQAIPYLTQEAIQAQSANVDGVSGASATSAAFKESLQSALNQAK